MEAAKTVVGLLLAILVTIASNNHNSTSYITVPINYTSRYYFARDTATILVINQFDVKNVKDSGSKKPEVLAGAAYTSIKFIGSQLDLLPHVRVINLVDSLNFLVNTDSVKSLASKYEATHVLALKSFDANIVPTADETGEKNQNT